MSALLPIPQLISHTLGFPRIGAQRELKKAQETYWKGELSKDELLAEGRRLRALHWNLQRDAGLDLIPTGDFAWYDQVLNTSLMLGAVPSRFVQDDTNLSDIDTLFRIARGRAPSGEPAAASEMTKWFDTNYHYIVPELHKGQAFEFSCRAIVEETREALALGHKVKPVLVGPLTWLWLGKVKGEEFDRLSLLDDVVNVYGEALAELAALGIEWVQMDEPILVLDLPYPWQQAFEGVYNRLQSAKVKILLATYFGELNGHAALVASLPVAGVHVDAVRAPEQVVTLVDRISPHTILSVGVVNGRNIWRADISGVVDSLQNAVERLGERLWIAPSCSLLHVPVDVAGEDKLDDELKGWLAFAVQKCEEVAAIASLVSGKPSDSGLALKALSDQVVQQHRVSSRVHNLAVQQRVQNISDEMDKRHSPYFARTQIQKQALNLPLFPTTTIGSFPQTTEIRRVRRQFKKGELSAASYRSQMESEIKDVVARQEQLGLDVLVHGEAERNDMVEYFGEQLDGFAFTSNGWVQSYGSRCVKPPVIVGDISRPCPMTIEWSRFAQQQTRQPMKGMLTGPVTILCWSFPREDVDRKESCLQLALALRDEVIDLEKAGIGVIQIDEPAIREGLPLKKRGWPAYLNWATKSFRISASGVQDKTQIHTHMCYSEFNDIIEYIASMDADVITIETSRSDMELLDAFERFEYPNEIGPGVYDIHSPNVPEKKWIKQLMKKAAEKIPAQRLWVNPDCGLKTRDWPEVEAALGNMVAVARELRAEVQGL
ncbi:5-methyltetrahydropteroyltriglutamate--homocysteine S-methyltransferase [Sansalvadorimonas verongulae]|uniref:5-methyltetrahydropteroyltriglutamate-- homocysteine S-methyltransferase n=1 Tax=Sansalvadorimonas verongulae TaxID=2172824 RepID=UPI0012BD1F5D|nr:5-methyltetrahydropteroyltriglutamate--homocysteine S-methyltransferase [Sansalvadorimonas verongulae]MTI12456.1 5-methyltetrahydropteroyltriglutamate--homocysteine S-methyltransferase [Sansalvadorimonas verongulae]